MTKTRRWGLACAVALCVAAIDLLHLGLVPTPFHHERSAAWLVATIALAAALLTVAPRAPSKAIATAAGIAAGGAIGNALSAIVWPTGVPDPIVYGAYAFNLADVAVVLGVCSLVAATLATAWTQRGSLREPV